jgi:Integrase zinc binding domain
VTDTNDNHHQIILKPKHFAQVANASIEDSDILERDIQEATDQDPEVVIALRLLKERGPQQLTDNLTDWEERDSITFYKGQVYIPKVSSLREKIVCLCHNSLSTGHPGRHGTLKLVSQLYWWPSMATFVHKYVVGCDTCQRCKPARHPQSTLQPHNVPKGPWQTVGINLIMGLPRIGRYDTIVVYIDHYSKQVHVLPTSSDIDVEGIVDIHY